jgi:hypothetical protein
MHEQILAKFKICIIIVMFGFIPCIFIKSHY